jgi:hypothetical protein
METTLTTAGIACIIAAIVGGGLKAFGIEIRVLDSGRRQAALGAFGVLLVAAGLGWNTLSAAPGPRSSEQPSSGQQASGQQPSGQQASGQPSSGQRSLSTVECSLAWFANPAPGRVTVIESGGDAEVLAADQPKDEPVVIVVTEDGRAVGAIAFKLYASNDLFKITQVVNARCERLETFRNETRGGDRYVFQNWDTGELTFGSFTYSLRLGYHSGSIGGQVRRISMADPLQPAHSTGDCLAWFRNPPPDRVSVIESGTGGAEVLPADKPKDRPVVIVVTEDGRPVGAVAFKLYVSNDLFKITQVVNAKCERLESFRNETRGGDRRVLQNWDTVELTFGTVKYTLRLGYGSGSIEGGVRSIG